MESPRHNIPFLFLLSLAMTTTMIVAGIRFSAQDNMHIFKSPAEIPTTISEKISFMRAVTSTQPW